MRSTSYLFQINWIHAGRKPIPNIDRLKNEYEFITYFGSVGYLRNPKFIIQVFAKVKQTNPAIKLLLIGSRPENAEMEYIRKVCKKFNVLNDVIFTGRIDRELVKDYLSYTKISISAIPPFKHYLISSPTKIYESLGRGVPVVANYEIFEQKKVIKESSGGLLVSYNIDHFRDAIVYLLKNPVVRKSMGERGKKYIEKNYTYEAMVQELSTYFV